MKKVKIIVPIIVVLIILIAIIIGIIINSNNKTYELEKIEKYSYFKLYKNEKYGVIDDKGNVLIEPIYDVINIPNPTKDVFIGYYNYNETNGEYTTKVLNKNNEEILKEYEQVLPLLCEESTSNIPFEKSVLTYKENGKYGIINFSGKKITKAIYDNIESMKYREGTLVVKQNERYGAININGKSIIKIAYDKIESDAYYSNEKDYTDAGFIVQNKTDDGYRYGYINKNGKVILQPEYTEIDRIANLEDIYLLVAKNGKYGIIKNEKTIIPISYEEIEYNKANNLFVVQKNSKQGVLSINGEEILKIEYDYIMCGTNKLTAKKGENIEIYNKEGKKQDLKYDNTIETSNEDYVIIIDENNKFGLINRKGNTLIDSKYEYLEYAFGKYFIATNNEKVGIIDIDDKTIIDFKYDIIQKIKDKNALQAIISNENTIDIYNNMMIKQVSMNNATLYAYENYIRLLSNNDIKYLNNEGNLISNKEIFIENSVFAYNKNGKWGFVDKEDKIIVEAKYDIVTEFNSYGYAGICKNDKWGVVNEKGEIIVEPSYKIDWNEPEFIGKYCKLNFGYGFEYYTDELTK